MPIPVPHARPKTPLWLRALDWLADRDADWRQKQSLKALPPDRLSDMGLTRSAADAAFYRGWASRNARTDRGPVLQRAGLSR